MNISYYHYAKRYFKKVHEGHDFQMSVFIVTRIFCRSQKKKKKKPGKPNLSSQIKKAAYIFKRLL